MRLKFYSFVLVVFIIAPLCAYTQLKKHTIAIPAVMIKARAQKDRVLLRWAVNEPAAWKLANKYGYIIERYTILKNGKINTTKEKKTLSATPLKPKPQPEWATIIQQNDDAAIVAQGLFGENFQISGGDSKLAKIVNQSDELNQRFTFSLLAADRNFEAAQMAGWGLIDSTVQKGEKYWYRIYTAVPKEKQKIDTSGVYIGVADYEPLPQPKDLYGVYGDKSVMLSWNYKLLKDVYTTYYIERSADGVSFSKLSDLPVANLNEKEDYTPSRMFYTDTLESNDKKYYYRVKGLTSFGETGPASEAVNGEGRQVLAYVPNIKNADILNDSTAKIEWEFAAEGAKQVDHFELNQSPDASERTFKTVIAKIEPAQRNITFSKLLPTNYFTITAVDKNGNKRSSFPYLVQPVDSTPPAIPTGLTASIDTLGNVTLKWKANTETDLLGYTILKSNLKTEEAAVLNGDLYTKSIFSEKISLKTLNSKVYYAVIALDQRMNQSKPSSFVELVKPDKIPPTTPVFKDYTVTDDGKVNLNWINSNSEDVTTHKLYRKSINEKDWQLIKEFEGTTDNSYKDDSVKNGETVAYTLIAVDKSNNESAPAPPLTVQVNNTTKIPAVKNLKAELLKETKTITISWAFDNKDVVEYTVYRALNKGPFTTWQVLDAKQTSSIEDKELAVNNVYHYAVRATLKDGRMSGWKEVKVEY